MKFVKHFVCGLLLIGFCSSASIAVAESSTSSYRSAPGYKDENLEHTLRDALTRNPALRSVDLNVSRGTVTLTGEVTHYQDKLDADAIAHQLQGVRVVQNRISLNAPAVDDSELEDQLEDRLRFARADIGLTFPQIQVEAHRGIVSLSGSVKDAIEHAAVLSLVGSSDGVLSIKDQISIDPVLPTDEAARTRVNKAVYRAARAGGEIGVGGALPVRAALMNGTVALMGAVANSKTKDELLTRVRDTYGVVSIDDEVIVRNTTAAPRQTTMPLPSRCVENKEVASASH